MICQNLIEELEEAYTLITVVEEELVENAKKLNLSLTEVHMLQAIGKNKEMGSTISELAAERVVLLSTHIVSDVEYIANEIMLMGDGHIVRSGTPEKIMSSVPDRVWSCTVPRSKAQDWAKEYKVANMKTTSGGVELRILCEERPCPDAKQEEITLEDVFLYYFGEKGGDEDGLL